MARSANSKSVAPLVGWPKLFRRLKVGCSLVCFVFAILVVTGTIYAKRELDKAALVVPNLPDKMIIVGGERSVIVAKDGKVLESMSTEFRKPVRIQDVPAKMEYATLAAEDKRFFEHSGVDYWSMARAMVSTVSGKRTEGASTITMQLAKRVYTSSAKTLNRKVEDMALATMIERQLSKEQILELYLNQVFYGAGAYGVSAAAEVYFGKSLQDLTWGEAATIARCVRRPSDENPFVNEKIALRNRDVVLGIMHDEGWMTDKEYETALSEKLLLKKSKGQNSASRVAPYFCDYVKAWIRDNVPEIDLSKGGYRIETTLDPAMQKYTEQQVKQIVQRNRRLKITTAAFLLMDKEGRILSMVGGPDYQKNQFNVITQGRRQPGSSFKPLVYATAFEYGALSPYGTVSNEPFEIEERGKKRFIKGGGRGGEVSVRSAIAQSINTPAMWAMDKVGLTNVINTAHNAFGIKTELEPAQTIALGADEVTPIELATAYSVFQNSGDRFTPFGIVQVIGPDGLPVRILHPEYARKQLSQATVEGIDYCLRSVVMGGTGNRASSVTNARGKTGTTSSNKDAWFCGYTDKFLAVGWVANEVKSKDGRVKYQPMDDYVMGGHLVAPLWAEIVGHAQELYGEESRRMKDGGRRDEPADDSAVPAEENPGVDTATTNMDDPNMDASPDAPVDNSESAEPPIDKPKPIKPKPETRDKPKQDPPTENDKIVFVEICADSGQRASIYCPERVRRAFKSGTEPKGRCQLHKSGN